jgi:hypothetical protein
MDVWPGLANRDEAAFAATAVGRIARSLQLDESPAEQVRAGRAYSNLM